MMPSRNFNIEGALEKLIMWLADPEALAGVLKAHVVAAKAKAETVDNS